MTIRQAPGRPFLAAEWVESFTITGSGRLVAALSTVDGPRLHVAGGSAGLEPANLLPSSDQLSPVACGERVAFWARLPHIGDELILHVADLAAGTLAELPARVPLQPHALVWSTPEQVITSRRTADGGDLIRLGTDGSEPEVLWRLPSGQRWIDPMPAVGPDGRVAFTASSDVSQNLLLLDPADNSVTTLVEGNRSAAPTQARWSPDGKRILVLVRRRRAVQTLLVDLVAGVIEVLDLPAPAELPTWNDDGSMLAFASADWPWTRLLTYEMAGGRISTVPLPDGVCGERHQWRGDDCYFVAFGPDLPPGVRRWRPGDLTTSTVTPPVSLPQRTSPTVMRIPTSEGFDLPALVHEPVGPARGTVVELHGGPAMHWRVAWNPILLAMTAAGYRVVLVETRGTTFNAWPIPPMPVTAHGVQELADVGYCLVELVRKGLAEPGRIVLAGHSHGAYVAYRASLVHRHVAGVIMTSGYLHPSTLAGSADPEVHRFAAVAYSAAATDGVLDAACPVLAVHGERDRQVPAGAAAAMFERLAGTGHRWLLLPGEEHGFRQRRSADAYADAAVDFLGQVLNGA